MQLHNWDAVPLEQLNASIGRKVIHCANMTVAKLSMAKGAVVPRHSHVNEQITNVESGRLRFLFDDREVVVGPGESLVIAPGEPHQVEVLEECVATDLFSPIREDWIRGDDAYLRNSSK